MTVNPVKTRRAAQGAIDWVKESGDYSQPWATLISPGHTPDEEGQRDFNTGNTKEGAYSRAGARPEIAGKLTFTPG